MEAPSGSVLAQATSAYSRERPSPPARPHRRTAACDSGVGYCEPSGSTIIVSTLPVAIAAIDVVHRQQRAQQQPGADKQKHGRGNLADHEQAANRSAAPGGTCGCRRSSPVPRQFGDLPGRREAKQQPDQQRRRGHRTPTRASNVKRTAPGRRPGGINVGATFRIAAPTADSHHTSDDREHQALGQELADDASPARAERRTHRQLARREPWRVPGAGSPRWRSRSAAQSRRRRGRTSTSDEVAAEQCSWNGSSLTPPSLVRRGKLSGEPFGNGGHVGRAASR